MAGPPTITPVQFSILNGILSLLNTTYGDLAEWAFHVRKIYKQIPPKRKLCQEDAALIITYGCGILTRTRKSEGFTVA